MFPELLYLDWILMALTVVYLQLLAMKKRVGWLVGIFAQLLWIYFTISKGLYGLTVLSVIMMGQFLYGWHNSGNKRRKKKDDDDDDDGGSNRGPRDTNLPSGPVVSTPRQRQLPVRKIEVPSMSMSHRTHIHSGRTW